MIGERQASDSATVRANGEPLTSAAENVMTAANIFYIVERRRGFSPCLLYTSDAADELDGVDLGGRRIIKKKFFSSRRRHTRSASVSWARRCV